MYELYALIDIINQIFFLSSSNWWCRARRASQHRRSADQTMPDTLSGWATVSSKKMRVEKKSRMFLRIDHAGSLWLQPSEDNTTDGRTVLIQVIPVSYVTTYNILVIGKWVNQFLPSPMMGVYLFLLCPLQFSLAGATVKVLDKTPGCCVFKITSPYAASVKVQVDTIAELTQWTDTVEQWYFVLIWRFFACLYI